MNIRIGNGIDVHQLVKGVPFIIGGVQIDTDVGIKGHSDGDVLIHAIVDALLGALSLGDIGIFFPSNKKWENSNSSVFLKDAINKIKKRNYKVINIDSTIILQNPKISDYFPKIKNNLSRLIGIDITAISIKATTTDYLGFIGKDKGIAAFVSVLIYKDEK